MTPLEYMFSSSTALEDVSRQPVRILNKEEIPEMGWAALSTGNAIAFESRREMERWAFSRRSGDSLEIVSPFGCCSLPLGGVDPSQPLGLLNVMDHENMSTWLIHVSEKWQDSRGGEPTSLSLKAIPLSDGRHEPMHSSMSFRGIDSKPDFWTVVLLPRTPDGISSEGGRAIIDSGGRQFVLPEGVASEQVLAGKVQWGLPDDTGFFVLQPRLR